MTSCSRGDFIRWVMRGKRCVLVTNRPEPDLCKDMAEWSGMEVTVCLNQARRLDAVVDAIKARRIAVVMLVTSFLGHDVDAKLQGACRGGSTRLLRVRKGKARVLMDELAKHVFAGHQPFGHLNA